ncbi:GvpL/GvpF family gas vesicle protein [Actinoplanes sp. NPDC051859]|uniref:GvpL/GvpF family gas vesicle protein n=1 Tax=Actinoplanes sp. NPDC051859 TaxID=3363909 RepID=UPI0037B85C48
MTAYYRVYGIVDATFEEPGTQLLPYGAIAAVIDGPFDGPPTRDRAALLHHAQLLDRIATRAPVLPARFGTVLTDLSCAPLAAHQQEFLAGLERLRGHVQFSVTARHVRQVILREVVDTRPDIAQLCHTDGYQARVRLGELVAHALAATRNADAHELWSRLAPLAAGATPRPAGDQEAPFGGAFLVSHDQRASFEAAAEELARRWAGRARIRLLGPTAAYDFVAPALALADGG